MKNLVGPSLRCATLPSGRRSRHNSTGRRCGGVVYTSDIGQMMGRTARAVKPDRPGPVHVQGVLADHHSLRNY
jgi:hypothetical protein